LKTERIQLHDLRAQDAALQPELRKAVDDVLRSGLYVGGPQTDALEHDLATYLAVPHVVAVNSGTDALFLILRAAGIGTGDEVVVPSYTFIASATAVSLAGAVPVFVDSLHHRFTIDPKSASAAVTARTRALIAVHLFGEPADLDELRALCDRAGILLIEDVAQAFGARYRDGVLGSFGGAAAFSFYPTKNFACAGDGGAIAVRNAAFAETLRSLRDHGRRDRDTHVRLGVNSRLDEIQAAMLRVKLPHVDTWNDRRRGLAELYCDGLRGTHARVPHPSRHVRHVYNQFVIAHPERDGLQARLNAAGIQTAVYYARPCHRQPLYLTETTPELPVAEEWSRSALALPMYPELPERSVEQICDEIRSFG